MINVKVKIVPVGDAIHITASAREQVWRKPYLSMKLATNEAEELGLVSSRIKQLLDDSQPMPSYPHGFEGEAEVDIAELVKRGFLQVRDKT